ncbi:MAG: hypothetical protein KGZ82_02650 [Bacteroidales bacterium]|nr:hypothetical protein [Bacteroidales bacterium]
MKKSVSVIMMFLAALMLTVGGCALDDNIDIPGGNDDDITKFLGTWSVTDNALKLNYEVTIERSQTNSAMVIMRNFAGSGASAQGLVAGSSIVIDQQVIGQNWFVSGNGSYVTSSRLQFTYSLTIGGENEQRSATYSK